MHVPFLPYPILPDHLPGDMAIFRAQILGLCSLPLVLISHFAKPGGGNSAFFFFFPLWILLPLIYSSLGNIGLRLRLGNEQCVWVGWVGGGGQQRETQVA